MRVYRHTQVGIATLWALGAGVAAGGVALALVPPGPAMIPIGLVFVVLLICFVLFGWLSVEVDATSVRVWSGPGLIRRTIRVADIAAVRVVRNRWWYGWGIRLVPRGWMWNVAGLDAVELEFAKGRCFRIGTDEPRRLAEAIERARAAPSL